MPFNRKEISMRHQRPLMDSTWPQYPGHIWPRPNAFSPDLTKGGKVVVSHKRQMADNILKERNGLVSQVTLELVDEFIDAEDHILKEVDPNDYPSAEAYGRVLVRHATHNTLMILEDHCEIRGKISSSSGEDITAELTELSYNYWGDVNN